MSRLHRISVWGLFVGWLVFAFASKTVRSDESGMWILVNPILAVGAGISLISSIGIFVSMAARPARPGPQ